MNEDLVWIQFLGIPSVLFAPYGSGSSTTDGEYYAVVGVLNMNWTHIRAVHAVFQFSGRFGISFVPVCGHLRLALGSDFHVHSRPSHDSGVSYELRVSTMVSEGLNTSPERTTISLAILIQQLNEWGLLVGKLCSRFGDDDH